MQVQNRCTNDGCSGSHGFRFVRLPQLWLVRLYPTHSMQTLPGRPQGVHRYRIGMGQQFREFDGM